LQVLHPTDSPLHRAPERPLHRVASFRLESPTVQVRSDVLRERGDRFIPRYKPVVQANGASHV
jgi:hypothetical protein